MSFTIHPFCENGASVPRNCVHAGPVSLGLLPKDYKADVSQLWRAGINPGTNLLVASTTFARGLVGNPAGSTPRYWWISGPMFDQPTLEMKVKEVVGRLPERAPDNYEPFSVYVDAYEWAKSNGYALINCNYPDYRLGDFDGNTRSLINIETGFLPSFDGSTQRLRNLANPTASVGFGTNNPYAVPHESILAQSAGVLGSPSPGIGAEGGITLLPGSHISQITNPIQSGITNGIIFETVVQIPDPGSTGSYTVLQARDAADSTLFTLGWDNSIGWKVMFGASLAYSESPLVLPGVGPGVVHICAAIPRVQSGLPVKLWINGASRDLIEVGTGLSWNTSSVRFSFGSKYNGTSGSDNVSIFYSAKVHDLVSTYDTVSIDPFVTTNWPIVQPLYGL